MTLSIRSTNLVRATTLQPIGNVNSADIIEGPLVYAGIIVGTLPITGAWMGYPFNFLCGEYICPPPTPQAMRNKSVPCILSTALLLAVLMAPLARAFSASFDTLASRATSLNEATTLGEPWTRSVSSGLQSP